MASKVDYNAESLADERRKKLVSLERRIDGYKQYLAWHCSKGHVNMTVGLRIQELEREYKALLGDVR